MRWILLLECRQSGLVVSVSPDASFLALPSWNFDELDNVCVESKVRGNDCGKKVMT